MITERTNKDGSVVYVADFRDKDRRRFRKTFQTRREATDYERLALADVIRGAFVAPSHKRMAEIVDDFLRLKRADGLEAGTVRYYQDICQGYIAPELGALKITEANDYSVLRAAGLRWKEKSSAKYARKVFGVLGQVFELALEQKIILENLARKTTVRPHTPADEKRSRDVKRSEVYTPGDVKALIFATEGGSLERVLLLVLAMTGMRIGEVLGLTWPAVDLEAGAIRVEKSLQEPTAKGEGFKLKAVKTIRGERVLERLHPMLLHEFKVWKLRCPLSDLDLVIANQAGGPLWRSETYRILKAIRIKAGVVPKAKGGHHIFRHVFASLALSATGRDLNKVAHWMGHADATITQQIYEHFLDDQESTSLTDVGRVIIEK